MRCNKCNKINFGISANFVDIDFGSILRICHLRIISVTRRLFPKSAPSLFDFQIRYRDSSNFLRRLFLNGIKN